MVASQQELDSRPDGVVMAVAVDPDGLRLNLHQQLRGGDLDVPGLGEVTLNRLCVHLVLAAYDLSGEGHVPGVAVGGQPVLQGVPILRTERDPYKPATPSLTPRPYP